MKKKKDLQKFPNFEAKYEYLVSKKYVKEEDLEFLESDEKEKVRKRVWEDIEELEDHEKHLALNKFHLVLRDDTRNQLWENNHLVIIKAMSRFIEKHFTMPTVTYLAQETGFSRPTIKKHLDSIKTSEIFQQQMDQFKVLLPNVMGSLYRKSLNGDVGAMRLFLQSVLGFDPNKQTNQTNYIQINNTIISQEEVQNLTQEQLEHLETILKGAHK